MPISNATIAEHLREYSSLLTLEGESRFKAKAYRHAAETIESLEESVSQLIESGDDLTSLPGIGKAISSAIVEMVNTGKLNRLDRSMAALPAETLELASKPRLDAKRVGRIYKKLGIHSLAELRDQLKSGKIGEVFGSRMEFHIRAGLDGRPRHLLWAISETAERLLEILSKVPRVTRASAAGSLRRKQETVGDLNFLCAGNKAESIFTAFAKRVSARSIDHPSESEAVFHLTSGIDVVLKVVKTVDWGLALIEQTGSREHVRELVDLSKQVQMGNGSSRANSMNSQFSEEKDVYSFLGLKFIEPELREGRGEIEASRSDSLPHLVSIEDLHGDLHMHTTESDGANTVAEMAKAAKERGYEYIAITDHSQTLKIANGLTEKRLREHIRAIDQLNAKLKGFRILKSAEVDILEDGSLDYSDSMLNELDLTVCSIHSKFALNKEKQTERILKAMDNKHFSILGHASGRLLLSRPGYEIDVPRILKHARQSNCFVEINSSPNRLDISDENAKLAKALGVLVAVNTDAHSIRELDFIGAGLNQARRGWLERQDVLNCLPLKKLLLLLRR